jgi:glycosyltransferase involved in cell wall biosynthesis|tara:strand:+ start:6881 stop:7966 length:1086 start_codon:yes stop_codon:yes gene_type:complete
MRIIFSVTNDLNFDQRMARICSALSEANHKVTLVGRKKINSKTLKEKPYKQYRLNMFFQKGKMFYVEYNIRLFFYLLFEKADAYCAIDLDSILPHYLVTRIKTAHFGYDAHEYFAEMEEVVIRPTIKSMWKRIERMCVPKVDFAYTISNSYKKLFEDEYNARFEVIRNVCRLEDLNEVDSGAGPFVLYQGSVNVGRGLEQLIEAMQKVNANLIICGAGDVLEELKTLAIKLKVQHKVEFKGYVDPIELRKLTPQAAVGVTFFTNDGLSNKYSLANRFFDYFHAGVPQLAMNYPEYSAFNNSLEVAYLIDKVEVKQIEMGLNKILSNPSYHHGLKVNCMVARAEHNWQKESEKLIKIYADLD